MSESPSEMRERLLNFDEPMWSWIAYTAGGDVIAQYAVNGDDEQAAVIRGMFYFNEDNRIFTMGDYFQVDRLEGLTDGATE